MNLSLIIPTFNEQGGIEQIVKCAQKTLREDDEVIIVDDGSIDGTAAILKQINRSNIRVITHTKNRGNSAAIMSGVQAARHEWICTIDADGTYAPEDIELLRNKMDEKTDMIVGVRTSLQHSPPLHRIGRNILRRTGEVLSGSNIPDINSGLRIVRKKVLMQYADRYPERFSMHIVLTLSILLDGKIVLFEPISYGPRIGKSKLSSGLRGIGNFCKFLGLMLKTKILAKKAK